MPRKGALFHFHFAKLYLSTHIFRGLAPPNASSPPLIPPAFLETAHSAITAAVSIISMILTDSDVQSGLVGLPCYIQSMIGFACMFLAKVTSIHGEALIERETVVDLVGRLVGVYRGTGVGRWHLVPLMGDGLERLVGVLKKQQPRTSQHNNVNELDGQLGATTGQHIPSEAVFDLGAVGQLDISNMNLDPHFLMDTSMGMGMGFGGSAGGSDQPLFGDEFGFGSGLM